TAPARRARRIAARRLLLTATWRGVLRRRRGRLLGEYHALSRLARVDAQHRVAGHADAVADAGETRVEFDGVGTDREVLGRRGRDVQHDAPFLDELARHL